MRSNHTISYLNERISYMNVTIQNMPKYEGIIRKDLEEVEEMKLEAIHRNIIGFDTKDNARVYLADGVIYVEGKPSGWSAENFNITKGQTREVCYDGGTNWRGTLEFTETV